VSGSNFTETMMLALRLAEERDLTYIHGFNAPSVIAGQVISHALVPLSIDIDMHSSICGHAGFDWLGNPRSSAECRCYHCAGRRSRFDCRHCLGSQDPEAQCANHWCRANQLSGTLHFGATVSNGPCVCLSAFVHAVLPLIRVLHI
jgi:hypothetical protein